MNFLKIAGSDIKGIFKNRFIRVSVIAIIIVPLLYSLLYLDAFWDPYGKLKDMPVAVVNLDKGTTMDGKFENHGQDFVDNLKEDERVGWKFVSEEDADEGLEGNKYYAKLVITEDFSKDVVSAKEGAPKQASLKFVCNEKKNFLASQVNSKVESALKEEITKNVTDTYVTGAFDNLYKVKDGMGAAADGSGQINDGLTTLNGKVPELADGANKLNDGSNQLYDGQVTLNDGISQLNGKVPELALGAKQLRNGANDLQSGTSKLYNGYTTKIYPGVTQIDDGLKKMQAELKAGRTNLETKSTEQLKSIDKKKEDTIKDVKDFQDKYKMLKGGVNLLISSSEENAKTLVQVETLLKSGDTSEALKKVQGITNEIPASKAKADGFKKQLEDGQKEVDSLNEKITNQTDEIKKSALGSMGLINEKFNAINDGVNQLSKGSGDLREGLTNTFGPGLSKVNSGASQLSGGLDTLSSKVPTLTSGVSQLYTGSKKLVSGQGDLKDGITTLNGKVPDLKDGVTKLHDGSNELASKLKDGSSELNDGLVNTAQVMGSFVASPVNLEVAPINPVPNYGAGFAPYFINLSLWIGAIMMFFVISAKTEQYEGATKFDKAFGKFLSFGFVGILQAVLVGVVVLTLGLSPGNVPLYFVSLIFYSLVYIAIVQCLISLFGDAGRLLSIVLLILQLTACAGTFPLELVPRFFVVLNPFMPFTYSVDALREICSASVLNYGVIGKDFAVLAIVLVVFLTISIAGATFGEKMQRVIEGRKEGIN